ncbi:methyltransferase [Vibrio sp. HDW18]|uniref:methyltransferase n=1 Tax=Vibrio sp. HDW18 TaxID=2714948 RepID=UPI00140C4910|nr:methyltransferase [Vibrio sp. HDW18]QIL86234.1 methyltransferase [Vibrio sp. HDW18]
MHAQFKLLDLFLTQSQSFWRYEAFHSCSGSDLPWGDQHPELSAWLIALEQDQIEYYKLNSEHLCAILSEFFPQLAEIKAMLAIKPAPRATVLSLPKYLDQGIPGRKWQQIVAMSSVLLAHHQGAQWLEWCAGKGYLGRILASVSQQPVVSFEYQAELCAAGQQQAKLLHLPMHFVQGDAFQSEVARLFEANTHAVALHACGDLHVKLLQYATAAQVAAISFSPCCYHLIRDPHYQAMSNLAQQSTLHLTQQELRLPLQETVTGGERVKRQRQQEMVYRLGLDALLSHELNQTAYIPIPSIQKSHLNQGFAAFCDWALRQKNIDLDATQHDLAYFEQLGEQRFWQMERVSLVQQGFRRLLELWLVLDKSLYLQEQGYQVTIGEFCDRQTTPRNLMVNAQRIVSQSR